MDGLEIQPTTRVTCTLPLNTLESVDFIAKRIGCTRSAVIAHMLSGSCLDLVEVVESSLPKRKPKGSTSRRASGRSAEELGAIFDHLEGELRKRDMADWVAAGFELEREQDG